MSRCWRKVFPAISDDNFCVAAAAAVHKINFAMSFVAAHLSGQASGKWLPQQRQRFCNSCRSNSKTKQKIKKKKNENKQSQIDEHKAARDKQTKKAKKACSHFGPLVFVSHFIC